MATNTYLEIHKLLSKKYPEWDFFFNYIGSKTLSNLCTSIPLGSFQTALDLGSGFGGPAIHLARASQMSILGIERVKSLHKFASELVHLRGLDEQIQFILGDFHLIPRGDSIYNFIYALDSFLSINSTKSLTLIFDRCWRMLRPGGYFLFTFLCPKENLASEANTYRILQRVLPILLSSYKINQNLLKSDWSVVTCSNITVSSIKYIETLFKKIIAVISSLNKEDLFEYIMDIKNKGVLKYLKTQVLDHWAFIAQKRDEY
ncbi:MAG: SAM-dependent methyltransferase [Candidatus Hermodarchaeota archaeon]